MKLSLVQTVTIASLLLPVLTAKATPPGPGIFEPDVNINATSIPAVRAGLFLNGVDPDAWFGIEYFEGPSKAQFTLSVSEGNSSVYQWKFVDPVNGSATGMEFASSGSFQVYGGPSDGLVYFDVFDPYVSLWYQGRGISLTYNEPAIYLLGSDGRRIDLYGDEGVISIVGDAGGTIELDASAGSITINDHQVLTQSATGINFVSDKVGIGTNSPVSKLSVAGSADFASGKVAIDTTGKLKVQQGTTLATVVGDITGDSRGASALDIQSSRGDGTFVASGDYSIAVGIDNISLGEYAITYGNYNTAAGAQSIAMGILNHAEGMYSAAIGNAISLGNYAIGDFSIAMGIDNYASHEGSIGIGLGTYAHANNSIAIGRNVTNETASSLMIGPSNTAKVTILSNGNVGIGTITPQAGLHVTSDVRFDGRIRVEPQGDLDMGDFDHEPTP